jgi:hypothetical protein
VIVVPTPKLSSPAWRALRMEGIEDLWEWRCTDPYDYGRWFAYAWDEGEPFVIVEWDVIPWPGAVPGLLDCSSPWCTHAYPLHRGRLATSFGIGKYIPTGPAPDEWRQTEWQQLDGQVVPVLRERLGAPHVHEPPVAHARRPA